MGSQAATAKLVPLPGLEPPFQFNVSLNLLFAIIWKRCELLDVALGGLVEPVPGLERLLLVLAGLINIILPPHFHHFSQHHQVGIIISSNHLSGTPSSSSRPTGSLAQGALG